MASSPPSSQISEVLLLHHTHTDLGYTHPQPVLWELQRRFIDQAIDLGEQTADWPEPSRLRWTCEVTCTLLHWLRHANARQIERFRALVRTGQMSAGAMFSNGTPLSNAEQLARGLYPLKELRQTLGLPLSVAINHDINGVPWPLAQLLLDSGVQMLLMGINAHFGGYPSPRPRAFHWQTPDGRALLAWNGEHYSLFGCVLVGRPGLNTVGSTDLMAEALQRHFKHLAATGYPHDFIFLTGTHVHHCDNNPPYLQQARMVRRWNDEGRRPVIRFVTPEHLLARLQRLPAAAIPACAGDWTDYWNFGAGSAALNTKVKRHAVRRLLAVEMLRAQANAAHEEAARRSRDAWWHANVFDEHTWGIANPLETSPEDAAEQWDHKAHYAYQTRSLAGLMLRDELERLADNPLDGEGSQGLLLVNPAPVARRAVVRIPKVLRDGSWQHFSSNVQRLDIYCGQLTDQTAAWVGPVDLPPCGYRILPFSQLPAPQDDDGLTAGEDFLESPTHRLSFDRSSGRIMALLDKQHQWQIIDASSSWPFFGFVHEMVDLNRLTQDQRQHGGRAVFFTPETDPLARGGGQWNPDWPALRSGPTKLLALDTERMPGGISLVLQWEAPGVTHLRQRITLFAHRPVIELTASFRKTDQVAPEAIYFAFPVRLEAWRAYFDTADLPVEFDREQLPGVCRDWVTVGQWVALADQQRGVTLACPDAPLAQIGGFNFGLKQEARPPQSPSLLLSWVMNNYWPTNFPLSQPGPASFRYELTTHGAYDPVVSVQAGLEAAYPIEIHPLVTCAGPRSGQFLNVTGPGVFPLGVKPAEDGQSVIIRLVNVRTTPVLAGVEWPGQMIRQAWQCDTLEQNKQLLTVAGAVASLTLPSRALITLRLQTGPGGNNAKQEGRRL